MRLKKSKVAACEVIPPSAEVETCKYQKAIDLLQEASASLAVFVKENDELAQESIANIAVIILDLKGGCQ